MGIKNTPDHKIRCELNISPLIPLVTSRGFFYASACDEGSIAFRFNGLDKIIDVFVLPMA